MSIRVQSEQCYSHVERVESISINSIRTSYFYVEGVERASKWSYT